MVDTHGVPLPIVLSQLEDSKMIPCWITFYEKAVAAGWKPQGVISKLESAVGDVYGPRFKEGWLSLMKAYVQHRRLYREMRAEAGKPPQGG